MRISLMLIPAVINYWSDIFGQLFVAFLEMEI